MLKDLKPPHEALLLSCLVTIFFISNFPDPYNLPKAIILIAGSSLLLIRLIALRFTQSSGGNGVFYIALIFLTANVFSALFSDQSISRTLIGTWGRNDGFLTYLAFTILFLFISNNFHSHSALSIVYYLVFLGAGLTIYGFLQYFKVINTSESDLPVTITLGNSNFAGAFFAISILSLFGLLLFHQDLRLKLSILAMIFGQIFLLFATDNDQSKIMIVLGVLIIVFLVVLKTKVQNLSLKLKSTALAGVVSSLCLLVLFARKSGLFNNIDFDSLYDRFLFWQTGLRMFSDNLLFGVGVDAFGDWYRVYRDEVSIGNTGVANYVDNAHNIFVQLAATGGVFLVLSYLLLLIFILWRGILAVKYSTGKNAIIVYTLFSIWLVLQAQSLVSIDQIGLSVWNWTIAGGIVGASYVHISPENSKNENKRPVKVRYLNLIKMGVGILIIIPNIYLVNYSRSQFQIHSLSQKILNSESISEARAYSSELFQISIASNESFSMNRSIRILLELGQNDEALELAKRTVEIAPLSLESWHLLATIYEKTSQTRLAIEPRTRTVELDPLNPDLKKLLEQDLKSDSLVNQP